MIAFLDMRVPARRTIAVVGVALGAAALAEPVLAEQSQPYWGPHMWGGDGGWFLRPLGMILFWGAVIALLVFAVRWLSGSNRPRDVAAGSALDILRERFARGEIDKNEFEDRKKVLGAR